MKRCLIPSRKLVTIVAILAFLARTSTPLHAKSPVKMKDFVGTIDFVEDGVSTFSIEGSASHLGRYTCEGEVTFVPGEEEGTLVGTGVAVFISANGDQLVANVTWQVDVEDGDLRLTHIHFGWADFVVFSDGIRFDSTGRFEHDRPPGLVVIAIIAILIGLLVPAIQK